MVNALTNPQNNHTHKRKLCVLLTFMLFIRRVVEPNRYQDEEDEQWPYDLNYQLELHEKEGQNKRLFFSFAHIPTLSDNHLQNVPFLNWEGHIVLYLLKHTVCMLKTFCRTFTVKLISCWLQQYCLFQYGQIYRLERAISPDIYYRYICT